MEAASLSHDAQLILWVGGSAFTGMAVSFGILWNHMKRREEIHDARTEEFISVATEFKNLASDIKQQLLLLQPRQMRAGRGG